jgi:hypothetical protein
VIIRGERLHGLWIRLAKRVVQQPVAVVDSEGILRKRILGLVVALRWFGEDKARAVHAIVAAPDSAI